MLMYFHYRMVYIVFGVSGSGKTTVGKLLAQALKLPFYDADDFHSAKNISRMKEGTPLSDEDRENWLKTLADHIAQWQAKGGAVLACSALKEKYRQMLVSKSHERVQWVFLKGPRSLVKTRLANRQHHFMNAGLLDSQFETLEEPEYGISIKVDGSPGEIVEEILSKLAK